MKEGMIQQRKKLLKMIWLLVVLRAIFMLMKSFQDEDNVMAIAEPGQEGISVWDILGESFLQEVLQIGMFSVACSDF